MKLLLIRSKLLLETYQLREVMIPRPMLMLNLKKNNMLWLTRKQLLSTKSKALPRLIRSMLLKI